VPRFRPAPLAHTSGVKPALPAHPKVRFLRQKGSTIT
jgi:hypothetical protein